MKRQKRSTVGKGDASTRSDCCVTVDPRLRGGITMHVESKVDSLYGRQIRSMVREACAALGVRHAQITVVDQGALPFVLAARLEAALKRSWPAITAEFLPKSHPRAKRPPVKDRPRRSRLYIPGNEPKFFVNAGLHRPDVLILDLEDSVSPEEKDAARILVRNALRAIDFFGAELAVRINQGEAGIEDLRAILPQGPDLILIPKCEDAGTVGNIETEMRSIEKSRNLKTEALLLPIIESARGVLNAYPIGSASPRVCALAIGLEDYTADIGVERTSEGKETLFARLSVVTAAKAARIQPLDSVFSDVDDLDGLMSSSVEARAIGFEGRGCIHPRQINVIHEAFAPSAGEIEKARKIVRAARDARRSGSAVVALGSKMIDAPVVMRAERILRLAKQFHRGSK